MPIGLPDRAQAAAISPTGPVWSSPDPLEPVLLAHLRTHRDAQVWHRTGLIGFEQDRDGVRATVRDLERGAMTTVSARFVVGADGARSTARDALGIPMCGPEPLLESLTALFVAPLWNVVGQRRYGLYAIRHAEAEGVFYPAGGDRWVYGRIWEPGRAHVAIRPI